MPLSPPVTTMTGSAVSRAKIAYPLWLCVLWCHPGFQAERVDARIQLLHADMGMAEAARANTEATHCKCLVMKE